MRAPSNGVLEVGSVTPRPIAAPRKPNMIRNAMETTTPVKIASQEVLASLPSSQCRKVVFQDEKFALVADALDATTVSRSVIF